MELSEERDSVIAAVQIEGASPVTRRRLWAARAAAQEQPAVGGDGCPSVPRFKWCCSARKRHVTSALPQVLLTTDY